MPGTTVFGHRSPSLAQDFSRAMRFPSFTASCAGCVVTCARCCPQFILRSASAAYSAVVFSFRDILLPFGLGQVAMQRLTKDGAEAVADSSSFASHSRSVLSSLPLTMRVPSALNATLDTAPSCAAQRLTDGLAALRIPEPQRLVLTAADDARAIGAERHTRDRVLMAAQRLTDGLAALRIPEPQRLVPTAADDARAIGAERHTQDLALMCRAAAHRWAGRSSHPTAAASCPTAADDARAIGAERHAQDPALVCRAAAHRWAGRSSHPTAAACLSPLPLTMRVPSALNATLETQSSCPRSGSPMGCAALRIPEPQRLVPTAADDARAIGAERHARDPSVVSAQRLTDGLPALRIPQPQRLVRTAADDARAIGAERHAR